MRIRFLVLVAAALLSLNGGRAALGAPPATDGQGSVLPASVGPFVPPRIVFAGRTLPVPPALAPYRDPEDFALCIPAEVLAPLRITFRTDARAGTVTFKSPEGREVTVGARRGPRQRTYVPLIEVMEGLGGKCEWAMSSNTFYIRAVLTSVEMLGGQLRIGATLPVTARVNNKQPGKVIVDIAGAERGDLPSALAIAAPNLTGVRTGQFEADTARIVLDTREPMALAPLISDPATLVVLNLVTAVAARRDAPPYVPSSPPVVPAAPAAPAASPATPALVSGVSLRSVSDQRAQILIRTDRIPRYAAAMRDGRLTVDLMDSALDAGAAVLGDVRHPLLTGVQVLARADNAAQLVINLTRVVAYTVTPGPGGLLVDLVLPRSAGGRLAGKLVVVDAGHGGNDSGALGTNNRREKDMNLAIALKLRDALTDLGANVMMTRTTDIFVPLGPTDERSRFANRADADFFISVHCDSADRNRAVRGSTVYYHMQLPSGRALAQSIADRLASDVGGISSKGTRSDSIRFPRSGFAVLRNTRMLGVLVECGYMTNPGDLAQLGQTAVQKRIAAAIAAGLRDYIEGNPDQDTRTLNRPGDVTAPFDWAPETPEVPGAPTMMDPATNPPSLP